MKNDILCFILVSLVSQLAQGQQGAFGGQPRSKTSQEVKQLKEVIALNRVPHLVRQYHPQLREARFLVEEARGRLMNAGRWKNPSLVSSYLSDPDHREVVGSLGFNQAFPVAGRLRWEKAVNVTLVDAAEIEVADVERRLIAEAKRLTVRVLSIAAQECLRQRQLKLAQEFAATVKRLADRGEGSRLDVGQARLQETELELEVHHLDHELQRLLGQLRILMGLPTDCELTFRAQLPHPQPKDGSGKLGLERADYRAIEKRVEAARQEVEWELARRWQDVTVGVFAQVLREVDQPIGLENEQRVGLQVSVPLPIWQRNRGAVVEKRAKAARLQNSLAALGNEIRNDIAATRSVMKTLATHADEVRDELLPEARQVVSQLEDAYRSGQAEILTVLRARHQRMELEGKYLMAIEDYYLAQVRHETATGVFEEGKTHP